MKRFLIILLLLVAAVSPVPGRLQFQGIMTRPAVAGPNTLLNGLQVYYRLEDLTDSSGNALDMSNFQNAVTFSAGKINNAGNFSGSTLFHSDDSHFQPGTGDWSVAAWVKSTATTGTVPVCSYGKYFDTGGGYEMRMLNGLAYANFGDGTNTVQIGPSASIADGNYHLLIITAERAGNFSFYIDNSLIGSTSLSAVTGSVGPSSFYAWRIGVNWNLEFWDGQLDEVLMWNRGLNSTERAAEWGGGNGISF